MSGERFPNAAPEITRRLKQKVVAPDHEFFTIVQPGFEAIAEGEFKKTFPGIETLRERGGFTWNGSLDVLYRALLTERIATRILMRVATFRAMRRDELAKKCRAIPWELYLPRDRPVNLAVTSNRSRLIHTGLIEEVVRETIPSGNQAGSRNDLTVFVRCDHDRFTFSIDATGDPLYRRGKRQFVESAPLRETVAAAILIEAGISSARTVIDPMCGSGVFSIEAREIALGLAPGRDRDFAVMSWPSFSPGAWNFQKKSANRDAIAPFSIITGDISEKAVATAMKNCEYTDERYPLSPAVADFFSHRYNPEEPALIVINPPYGKRIGSGDDGDLYRKIGQTMRTHYTDCGYAIIVPGIENEKKLSLSWDIKILFSNGGINVAALIKRVAPRQPD